MIMYPIWLTMWKERMRRNSFWETAPNTPVTMVSPAMTRISVWV